MKKTISINISGILFHIEEDGYDTLRKYLDAINRHFSSYKDNQEIISDIENRIAEIFLSNLKNNKQVITAENVDKLIEKMGTIADFASVEEEKISPDPDDEKITADEDFYKYFTPPNTEKGGYKKLVRLENKKILGGVCAGLAHYFAIDPLWTRLIAILLLFSGNLKFNFGFPDILPFGDFRLNVSFGLFAAVAYIVLWIILPVSYEVDEDKHIKKLYRNPDDKVIGGVASGLAAYFGVEEVIYVRLALVLLILAGGSGFLIYLILWIITPVAGSITERIRMKGGEITLDNIDSTIKENMAPSPPSPESNTKKILLTPFRIAGQIIEAIGSALGPIGRLLLNIVRVIFGLFVFFIGLGLTIAPPVFSLALYMGIFTNDGDMVLMDNFPVELFSDMVPIWLVIGASFLLIIPGIIIILLGLSVLMQKNLINGRFGFVALGLWLLCIGIYAFQVPLIIKENWHTVETQTPVIVSKGTLILRLNPIGEESTFNQVNLKLEGTADSVLTLRQNFFSRGKTKAEAMNNAKLISYNFEVMDSVVTFDEGYDIANPDVFRDQKLNLNLNVPYDRPFIMEKSLLEILRNTIYRNGYRSSDISQHTIWAFNKQGLVCLTCNQGKKTE